MPRTNLSSQFTPEQRKMLQPKIIARNTFRYTDGADTVIRLHATDIARKHADGSVTLNSGGWQTVTTKERMNAALPAGFQLQQEKGIWYVAKGWSDKNRVPYFDGMNVPRDYHKPKRKGDAEAKRQDALRRKIRKFVCDVPMDNATPLPVPDAGDCFYCQLQTRDGQSLGDAAGNAEHLRSHVEERYLHGSLIVNALKTAGHREPGFMFSHGPRDLVRRALKRYLYRKLGLVS